MPAALVDAPEAAANFAQTDKLNPNTNIVLER